MSQELDFLIARAKSACEKAYAPYSKFPVGCALVSASGQVYTGCNVENISFGLTICAERAAVFAGVLAEGSEFKIKKVVIYTPTEVPITPCGACRQVIHEFGKEVEVVSVCNTGHPNIANLPFLLPDSPAIAL
ncbi:MAG: cytidine deaminase [Cyclobacteriaceae bacterium]|nr:cytidine deaminase [Cyclobacteriaceae bacterium]